MIFPRIITLSGVDGSGKTSIARVLQNYYQQKGLKARVFHIGATTRTSSEPSTIMSPLVGALVFFKDYGEIMYRYITSLGSWDIVIFDRFLYDSIVKIAYKCGATKISSYYPRFFSILFPIHHMAFLLIASPNLSFSRDREHSRGYHDKKNLIYQQLPLYFDLISIDATKTPSEVLGEMINLILL